MDRVMALYMHCREVLYPLGIGILADMVFGNGRLDSNSGMYVDKLMHMDQKQHPLDNFGLKK